jgi:hypothetical protein
MKILTLVKAMFGDFRLSCPISMLDRWGMHTNITVWLLLQHDCQEFLALLLDNLHEQLNTASCKSILSDVSTAPPTPHSQCEVMDEREPGRKLIDGMDQESSTQVSLTEWKTCWC